MQRALCALTTKRANRYFRIMYVYNISLVVALLLIRQSPSRYGEQMIRAFFACFFLLCARERSGFSLPDRVEQFSCVIEFAASAKSQVLVLNSRRKRDLGPPPVYLLRLCSAACTPMNIRPLERGRVYNYVGQYSFTSEQGDNCAGRSSSPLFAPSRSDCRNYARSRSNLSARTSPAFVTPGFT